MNKRFRLVDGEWVWIPTRKPGDGFGGGPKLTTALAVAVFRDAHAPGAKYSVIGKRYGVSAKSVGNIARGQAWGHMFLVERLQDGSYYVSERTPGAPRFRMTVGRRDKRAQGDVDTRWGVDGGQ